MFTWRRPTSVVDACHLLVKLTKHALLGCLFYTGYAIWFCLVKANQLREHIALALLIRKHTPNKLPTRRKRALTIPLSQPGALSFLSRVKQKTVSQTNSYLYSKLPTEIRQQIFELVICGDGTVLHVFQEGKKIGVWRCRKQSNGQPCSWTYPCSTTLPCNGIGVTEEGRPASYAQLTKDRDGFGGVPEHGNKWGVLALLCSSRQV